MQKSEPIPDKNLDPNLEISCYFCNFHGKFGDIEEWTEDNYAICPKCYIDSILLENITKEEYELLYQKWFNMSNSITIRKDL